MKKTILIIFAIFFIIMCILFILLKNIQIRNRMMQNQNAEYEKFLNKKIQGTELATLINKITDRNEKNEIEKDENNFYKENEENSITLEVKMTTIEETYKMEQFHNNDISRFVENFNNIQFECTKIEYNKKGKVKKLIFEEIPLVD